LVGSWARVLDPFRIVHCSELRSPGRLVVPPWRPGDGGWRSRWRWTPAALAANSPNLVRPQRSTPERTRLSQWC
jgi:hypothetical protein